MSLLVAKNISCRRAGTRNPVFQNLSFSLSAGEMLVLQGANGSGKTTLLLLCAKLLAPSSGTLQQNVCAHFIGVKSALHPKMSVEDNLRFCARLMGGDDSKQAVRRVLAAWEAEFLAPLFPHHLSAGQKRLACLMRLVLVPRPLWLLDEPFSMLDEKRVTLLEALLAKHQQGDGGVILAEHHKTFSASSALNMEQF